MKKIAGYILAKDEENNIGRCLASLEAMGIPVKVLDSGSSDNTTRIAEKCEFATVESYAYVNHLIAYNEICSERTAPDDYALVLDADMVLTEELQKNIIELVTMGDIQVVAAPVLMYWEGHFLKFGSLYPPKPILFRGGKGYFEASGHGEKVSREHIVSITQGKLIHDDRKEWVQWILAQDRYGTNLIQRWKRGKLNWKDRVRTCLPLMVLLSPLWSLFVKLGFLSGKVGLLYAIDRLIAEAIHYRKALACRIGKEDSN
jgi:glycosyltransferase involved in cell wall biosynthesis